MSLWIISMDKEWWATILAISIWGTRDMKKLLKVIRMHWIWWTNSYFSIKCKEIKLIVWILTVWILRTILVSMSLFIFIWKLKGYLECFSSIMRWSSILIMRKVKNSKTLLTIWMILIVSWLNTVRSIFLGCKYWLILLKSQCSNRNIFLLLKSTFRRSKKCWNSTKIQRLRICLEMNSTFCFWFRTNTYRKQI